MGLSFRGEEDGGRPQDTPSVAVIALPEVTGSQHTLIKFESSLGPRQEKKPELMSQSGQGIWPGGHLKKTSGKPWWKRK